MTTPWWGLEPPDDPDRCLGGACPHDHDDYQEPEDDFYE